MERKAERPEDDFARARYPIYAESACSPEVTEEFRGLRIRVPRKARIPAAGPVTLDPDAPWLPVCGVVRLSNQELEDLGVDATEGVVLVFVDRATGAPISFDLVPDKPRAPPDPTPPSHAAVPESFPEDQIEDHVFNEYFNVDAFMFRPDFPRRNARYRVHALLGRHKSNVVEVDVEVGSSPWVSSPAWRRYKAAFVKVEGIKSLGRLEKLEDQAANLEPILPEVFPGDPALARCLTAALRDRLVARRKMLQTPRGRLPRPDWKADVALSVERLDHAAAALRGLRALDVRDPWVDEKLVPAVELCLRAVDAALESLETQSPGDPDSPSLADRARAAIAAARSLLADGRSKR